MGKVTVRRLAPTRNHSPEQVAKRLQKLYAKCVVTESGCRVWQGVVNKKGYGETSFESMHWMTHRLAYVLEIGPIPPDMFVCHTCDTPACCEPSHFFLGDNTANMRDMAAKGRHYLGNRTHCPKGHEFTPENTGIHDYNGKRGRVCRACTRERQRREYHFGWRKEYQKRKREEAKMNTK